MAAGGGRWPRARGRAIALASAGRTGGRLFEELDDLLVVGVGEDGHLQVLHLVEFDLDLEDAHEEEVV